jgi:paraquat-inducible protein A
VPVLDPGMVAACGRCGGVLERRAGSSQDGALALAATSLLLLIPGNFLPLLTVTLENARRQDWPLTGGTAFWSEGYAPLSLLVWSLVVAAPMAWMAAVILVLLGVRGAARPAWLGPLFRHVLALKNWAMADVFLIGGLVAWSRLRGFATVEIGPGGWSFLAAGLATLTLDPLLDRRRVWLAIGPETGGEPRPDDFACSGCGRRAHAEALGERCPRCGIRLRRREHHSVELAAALVAAAYLLYIPANLLPFMTVTRFGRAEPNTILSGVRELLGIGLWPLALIVFLASIVLPLLKLSGLTWFIVGVWRGSDRALVLRTRFYRFIEQIGRWSNIDVFMLSILVALVQFGRLTDVRAEPGAVAFAGVVVLTMIASHGFDTRLMWDAAEDAA